MKNREWMEKVAADLQGLSNYAAVKDRLTVKLTGRAGNEEILEKLPHHDMEDMAVIYKIRIYGDACKTALAAVTNTMLKQYGITAKQLHRDAVEAASAHQPYVIRTMAETLNELCGCTWKQEDAVPMYVATNKERMNGASVLVYPDFMETAAERLRDSFYVLPSSIHEVILLPEKLGHDIQELQAMVRNINADIVAPEDRLSNSVYHYDRKEHLFELADKYKIRMRS